VLDGAGTSLDRIPNWFIEVHGGAGLEKFGGSRQMRVQIRVAMKNQRVPSSEAVSASGRNGPSSECDAWVSRPIR
jgi:hypothetical protein